jgi:hypothetical protein
LKAVCHITVLSADIKGAFNTGFDTVNLHRLTKRWRWSTGSVSSLKLFASSRPTIRGLNPSIFQLNLSRF